MNLLLRLIILSLCLLIWGCSKPNVSPSPGIHNNFALAVYDSDNYLISDPIGDLKNHTQYHKLLSLCKESTNTSLQACNDEHNTSPITDIYVISHGWDYTLEESMNLYNNYIHKLGNESGDWHKNGNSNVNFHPYYIFVSWPSTVRPISQTLKAILPYSLADSKSVLGWTSDLLDSVIFHLPTVWKQSLNTYSISHTPTRALEKKIYDSLYDKNQQAVEKDIPFSIVLYELIKYRDGYDQNTKPKIHLVGHSFGTKLLTLSALDAIGLWSKKNKLWDKGDIFYKNENGITKKIEKPDSPIESLLLFNAAYEPWELLDIEFMSINDTSRNCYLDENNKPPLDHEEICFNNRLKFIPRKAFVYSNYDYPNGIVFDASQIIISNSITKHVSNIFERNKEIYTSINSTQNATLKNILVGYQKITEPVLSVYSLGLTLVYSPLTWVGRRGYNLPFDYWYHINNNDTIPEQKNTFGEIGRKSFNTIHYFLPLDKISPFQTDNMNRNADKMGLFRSSSEALGRTGLYRMGVGRNASANLGWLGDYVIDPTTELPLPESGIPADVMCKYGTQKLLDNQQPTIDTPLLKRNIFYSFNGSNVLSGSSFLSDFHIQFGSHSDINSDHLTNCYDNLESKRDNIFNFTYNFTKKFQTEEIDSRVK